MLFLSQTTINVLEELSKDTMDKLRVHVVIAGMSQPQTTTTIYDRIASIYRTC